MLPGAALVASDPRLVRVVIVLRRGTTNATNDFFVLFLLLVLLNYLLATLLTLPALGRLGSVLELVESFSMLTLGSSYRSAGFWFSSHIEGGQSSN